MELLVSEVLYKGMVPLTTWYSRIAAKSAVEMFARAEPMRWKAALLGAKMVTSARASTAETRLVLVRAPARELRPAATAVEDAFPGIVRTLSIMWTTPPVKLTFCVEY